MMFEKRIVWLFTAVLMVFCASLFAQNYTDWTQPFAADANTRLLLHFDEALNSTTVTDSASYPVDGTLSADLAAQADHHVVSDKAGFGNALQILYTGFLYKKVDFPAVPYPDNVKFWMGGSDFTMEVWIRPVEANTYWVIFENYTGGDYNWGMLYDVPTAKMYMYFSWYGTGGWRDVTDWSTNWELNTWNHAAVTVQRRSDTAGRDVVKFWKNGVQVFRQDVTGWGFDNGGPDPDTGDPTEVNGPASFGGRWMDGHPWYNVLGKTDEFRLSDTIRYGALESGIGGSITLNHYTGDLSLVPVALTLKQGATVIESQTVTLTSNPGMYSFAALPGDYEVEASAPGFLTKTVAGIHVVQGDTASADVSFANGDLDGDNEVTTTDVSTALRNAN